MTLKLHTIASAGLASLAKPLGGQPVDNPALEEARAQMRSDIAAEVRLREAATGARDQAMLDRQEFERSNQELTTQNEEAARERGKLQARADELAGTLKTQMKDVDDLTHMVQEMTAAQTEASGQLTSSFATIERERATNADLRRLLTTATRAHADTVKRMDGLEAALKAIPNPAPVEAPEYEFTVAARDGNGRAAKYRATPVKKVMTKE